MSASETLSSTTTLGPENTTSFVFPPTYSFGPFFTPQPNALTRSSQLSKWSSFIQSYCQFNKIYKLHLSSALESPLFHNANIKRRLLEKDARDILDWMASAAGDNRAEWIGNDKSLCWVWWKKPSEWASLVESWVDDTGQKGTVLTLYELVEGEATRSQEFYGMDMEALQKSLNILVKRGKAQVFGEEDQQGVKFF